MNELRVSLTFDAEHPSRPGADPDAPARVLDALADAGVRTTFFVQGRWAGAFPALARRIAEDGHRIGNHSNYHAPMTLLSRAGIQTDVREAERRILQAMGVDPRPWFRCPFGEGVDREDVRDALAGLGYRNVPWDVDSGDWREDATPDAIETAVVEGIRRGSGSDGSRPTVVLLHTWPSATAAALPRLLDRLPREGAVLVPPPEFTNEA